MSMYSKPSDDDDLDLAIFVTKNIIVASSDFCLLNWSGETCNGQAKQIFWVLLTGLTLVAFPPSPATPTAQGFTARRGVVTILYSV